MSSHHFVKEGQEPALLIAEPVKLENIGDLLEWAPLVIVLEPALDLALTWGIKADIIIAPASIINQVNDKVAHQLPLKIIACDSASAMLEKGIEELISNGQRTVNMCVSAQISTFEKAEKFLNRVEITLFDEKFKWAAVYSGNFKKWLPAEARLHIRHISPFLITEGQVQTTGNEVIVQQDGLVSIHSEALFWVGESLK